MPVDPELSFPPLVRFCEPHLRHFSAVDGIAINREFLFEYSQFFEILGKLKSDNVLVDRGVQLDLDFKSHRRVFAPAGEIV